MSGPVSGVSTNNNTYSGFEIMENPNLQETGTVESSGKTSAPQANAPVEKNSFLDEFDDLSMENVARDGKKALEGATVTAPQVPKTLVDKLQDAIPARRFGFKNFLSAVGRGFMNFCHAARCIFTGGALWSRRAADHADFKSTSTGNLPDLPEAAIGLAYDATPEEIGATLGLRGKITLTPFPKADSSQGLTEKEQLNFRLYGGKDAGPKLSDIKQDPSRQDCWFLSSITSMLRAKGPETITRLIQPADTGDFAIVRMGAEHYRVPLAEVRGNGGSMPGVSDSAPWVKLLETAMAMHLANRPAGGREGMDYGSGALGLCALSGYENSLAAAVGSPCVGQPIEPGTNMAEKMTELKGRLAAGDPVMLSSPPNMKLALASGISPGHAVALLDVNADRQVCTVLDPYGRTRNVAFKDLVGFTVTTIPHEKKDEIGSLHKEAVSHMLKGRFVNPLDRMLAEEKAFSVAAPETGEVTQGTVDEAMSMLRERRNLTCDVGDLRHTFTLQDNAGEGNCFFYAALGGVDGKAVTLQSSQELRESMAQSTSELLGAAEQGQAKGLTKTISAEGKIRYEARYTDSEGKEGVIDVTPAVKELEQGDSITNYKEVDTLNGAFLAHHLKRPVIVHTHLQEFEDCPVMLEQRFDFDLMTGEKFDPNLKPVEIYYTGGLNGGHFQTVIVHQQEVVA